MTQAFEDYNQLRVLKRPLTGVYLSFFLMVTLLILVGATWMGLVPRQAHHAAGADAVGRRARDRRRPPRSARRAAEQRRVRRRWSRRSTRWRGELAAEPPQGSSASTHRARAQARRGRGAPPLHRDDSRAHHDRRRLGRRGRARSRRSTAPPRGCSSLEPARSSASRRAPCSTAPTCSRSARCWRRAARGETEPAAQEIALARDGQELHLAAVATRARRRERRAGGRRARARRRDAAHPRAEGGGVARGGAAAGARDQESADADSAVGRAAAPALRRRAAAGARRWSTSARTTIVGEVESLKGLVDEFSQFARMPSPRTVPTDLRAAASPTRSRSTTASSPTCASTSGSRRACRWSGSTPSRSAASSSTSSTTRSRRWSAAARSSSRRSSTPPTASSASIVADDGPGIPAAEREKLFLPYYSTKRRGSGLGLAIVRRIIAEHGGSIEVGDNTPRGTRFTIELPC